MMGPMAEPPSFSRESHGKECYFSNINMIIICKTDAKDENNKEDSAINLDLELGGSREKCLKV